MLHNAGSCSMDEPREVHEKPSGLLRREAARMHQGRRAMRTELQARSACDRLPTGPPARRFGCPDGRQIGPRLAIFSARDTGTDVQNGSECLPPRCTVGYACIDRSYARSDLARPWQPRDQDARMTHAGPPAVVTATRALWAPDRLVRCSVGCSERNTLPPSSATAGGLVSLTPEFASARPQGQSRPPARQRRRSP